MIISDHREILMCNAITKFMFDKSSVCNKDYQCRQHLVGTIRMMVNSELAYEYTPNDNAKKLI